MLKFLTHKLKTHSLNEGVLQKVEDEDHDSGTESDDEHGTGEEPEISMESEGGSSIVTGSSRSGGSVAASPYFLDSALPSDCDQGYDQHSSEEELEVINCTQPKINTGQEKRKWSQLVQKSQIEAMLKNKESARHWTRFKEDHEKLKSTLQFFSNEIKHSVMVPIGSKALMKGSVVHTNEVLVAIGDGWFIKESASKAAEICERRIKKSDEMLQLLQKEYSLLESTDDFAKGHGTFEDENCKEIVESYDEEEDKKWRVEHRKKEAEYRRKLADIRKETKDVDIKTEEDLWKHLDALELHEELEDELNRLGGNSDEDDFSDEESEESEDCEEDNENYGEEEEKHEQIIEKPKAENQTISINIDSKPKPKKCVTFAEEEVNTESTVIKIKFHHSDVLPEFPITQQGIVNSPRDIYTVYSKFLDTNRKNTRKANPKSQLINPLGSIVERTEPNIIEEKKSESRPVSKFKMARKK